MKKLNMHTSNGYHEDVCFFKKVPTNAVKNNRDYTDTFNRTKIYDPLQDRAYIKLPEIVRKTSKKANLAAHHLIYAEAKAKLLKNTSHAVFSECDAHECHHQVHPSAFSPQQ